MFNLRIETIFKEQSQESIASYHHITINDPEKENDEDDTPPEFEQGAKITVDIPKVINLDTSDDSCPIYINSCMTHEEEKEYVDLLFKFKDVVA